MATGFTAVLNGNLYDITTMNVAIGGIPITKGVFSEFNWSANKSSGKFEGNSILPAGYTPGHGSFKGSFKMLVSYFDDFQSQIKDLGYPSIVGVDFDVSLTFLVNNFGPTPANNLRSVNLIGVRIEDLDENTSGTDALMAECTCIIHKVETNNIVVLGGEDNPF